MTLEWMAYAFVVALLLGVAAHGAERGLRLAGRPGRWPWAAALLGSWLLPVAALLRDAPPLPAGTLVLAERATDAPPPAPAEPSFLDRVLEPLAALAGRGADAVGALFGRAAETAATMAAAHPGWLEAASRWGALLWVATAAVALAVVAVAVAGLLRRSRRWPEGRVLGEAVRLSPDFGPAVVGVLRPSIVLPRWVLRLGRAPVALILEHEREHRRSRDTLMLTLGGLAAVAAPWNLPLWWQLRRLRLAVELDCDGRVLRRGVPRREYGALLVEIGERVGRVGLPATALAEQSSFLERRLRMITETRSNRSGWKAGGGALLALGMVALACETPAPTEVREPGEAVRAVEAGEEAGTVREAPPEARYDFQAVEVPSDPLVIVDGVVVDRGLAHVQALDVERIEVVKGTEAVELYGRRGRNGIVRVTTTAAAGAADAAEAGAEARYEVAERPSDEAAAAEYEAVEVPPGAAGIIRERPGGEQVRPLVIVDGVITAKSLRDVDELEVESIEIIKGGAARALYGDRARSGVVKITTQAGRDDPAPSGALDFGALEVPPVVFVDGERWTRPLDAIRELEISEVHVLKDAAAERFLEGTGVDPEGRTVIRVTTRR